MNHATPEDIQDIVLLCLQAHENSPNHHGDEPDASGGAEYIINLMYDPNALVLFNGTAVLMAVSNPSPFKLGRLTATLFFYGSNGLPLLRQYIRWAKGFDDGPNEIIAGCTFGGDKAERTAKLYRRLGFEPSGQNYRLKT